MDVLLCMWYIHYAWGNRTGLREISSDTEYYNNRHLGKGNSSFPPSSVSMLERPKSTILRPFEAQWWGHHAGSVSIPLQASNRRVETKNWPLAGLKMGRRGENRPIFRWYDHHWNRREKLYRLGLTWQSTILTKFDDINLDTNDSLGKPRLYCHDDDDGLIPRQGASFDVRCITASLRSARRRSLHNIIQHTVSASLDRKETTC